MLVVGLLHLPVLLFKIIQELYTFINNPRKPPKLETYERAQQFRLFTIHHLQISSSTILDL